MIFFHDQRLRFKMFIFLISVSILVFLSSWQALNFAFWRDDWSRIWMANYRPDLLYHMLGLPDHPGMTIEQFLLGKVFKMIPVYWQLEGLLLKILASLSVAVMIGKLTKSAKSGYLAGLIFAASVGGIESFVWASNHAAALIICFLGIGIYFWLQASERESHNSLLSLPTFLGIILLLISFLISPARSAGVPVLIILWELFSLFRKPYHLRNTLLRVGFLISIISGMFLVLHKGNSGNFTNRPFEELGHILASSQAIHNFLSSLGNLLIGWIIPIPEIASLSSQSIFSEFFASTFLLLTFYFLLRFLYSHTYSNQLLFFMSISIPLLYLPNWWFYSYVVTGVSHRYLTLSSVFLIGLLVVFISHLSKKIFIIVASFLLLVNLIRTNYILASQLPYHSNTIFNSVWDDIDKQVDKDNDDKIFVYLGDDPHRYMLFDWSLTIPFAFKRHITDPKNFPILVYNKETLIKLLCGQKVDINSLERVFNLSKPILLDHLYAWGLKNNQVENYSQEFRFVIKKDLNCSN